MVLANEGVCIQRSHFLGNISRALHGSGDLRDWLKQATLRPMHVGEQNKKSSRIDSSKIRLDERYNELDQKTKTSRTSQPNNATTSKNSPAR